MYRQKNIPTAFAEQRTLNDSGAWYKFSSVVFFSE
jgi:hypothetical protein